MFNNKSSKRALVMSVLSLVLCVSMFVGTTFAWFTDSVTSANNIIKSGSLKVQMLWSDTVDGTYKDAEDAAYPIFNYQYWEPGYTEIKYIKIKNVGDLAFQFQLNILPDKTAVAGEVNLADVIDVYLLPAAAATRADVDAATPVGTLSDLIADRDGAAHGILLPNAGSDRYNAVDAPKGEIAYCIALKMQESAGNEYQNLSVGDGFSLQLLATQYTWEKDSFDHNYDEDAMFPPKADIKTTGPKLIPLMNEGNVMADETAQLLPKHNYEEAQQHSYRYWHADFVVYADGDIPAEAVTLAGYYTAFCDPYAGGQWIGMSSPDDIAKNTKIRLVEAMGNGSIFVNFEEICKYNDGTGFQCGVIDNTTGDLEGITLTVELRLYETTKDPDNISGVGGGPANEETGKYIILDSFSYTFGANKVYNAEDLKAALANADAEKIQLMSDIKVADATLNVTRDVEIDLNGFTLAGESSTTGKNANLFDVRNGGNLTIKNGTVTVAHVGANMGWGNSTNAFNVTAGGVLNIKDATIKNLGGSDMAFCVHLNNWGTATLNATNTVFESTYVAVRVFNSGNDLNTVNLNGCELKGVSNCLWVHNYTSADFGGKLYSGSSAAYDEAAVAARLNFTFTNTSFERADGTAKVIRYGFTGATYYDAAGNAI